MNGMRSWGWKVNWKLKHSNILIFYFLSLCHSWNAIVILTACIGKYTGFFFEYGEHIEGQSKLDTFA